MKYGFILTSELSEIVALAQEAEQAGWDGVFLPDDWTTAWIKLTAIAMQTRRILLGTMLTPLPEQLPWYVAAQTATLDQLSGGRVILTAGLGVLELDKFGLQENSVTLQVPLSRRLRRHLKKRGFCEGTSRSGQGTGVPRHPSSRVTSLAFSGSDVSSVHSSVFLSEAVLD